MGAQKSFSPFAIDDDIEAQMLSAKEVLYYARQFKGKTFCVFLQEAEDLIDIQEDLSILTKTGLRCLVFCPQEEELFKKFKHRHDIYKQERACSLATQTSADFLSSETLSSFETLLLVEYERGQAKRLDALETFFKAAVELNAAKAFYVSDWPGIKIEDCYYSTLSFDDFFASKEKESNVPPHYFKLLDKFQASFTGDVVILQGKTGSLFQETFTHRGSGTLISKAVQEGMRRATREDVPDILFMMTPYVKTGAVLPMQEEEIYEAVHSFYVYQVNKVIVASACFKEFEDYYEVGKVVSLPRYQGKGRAVSLVKDMLNKAKTENKKGVFALSVAPFMEKFFLQLGFKEVDKKKLPETWKHQYDMTRDSKAYLISFS